MPVVDLIGWLGTVSGTLLGVPQLLRLHRTRNVHGLSVVAWQAMVAVNLGWAAHGLRIGQAPQWVTSVLAGVATFTIVLLLSRQLGRSLWGLVAPGVAFAAVMVALDQLVGSAAFGIAAMLPALVTNGGQSIALVRSRDVAGVSWLFLVLALGNQVIWLSWALLVHDPGTVISATTNAAVALVNVVWYALRRLGLGPLFARAPLTTTGASGEPDCPPSLTGFQKENDPCVSQ